MAQYPQTVVRGPDQPFVFLGKRVIPNQYAQSMPAEQLAPYNLPQQTSYPSSYLPVDHPNQYKPHHVDANVAQIDKLNTQTKRTQKFTNRRIIGGFLCAGMIVLLLAAFIVPVVIILTANQMSSASTPSTASLPLFGVQLNLNPSSLPSSWSLCYSGTYAANLGTLNLNTILSTCNKNMLLLGCRITGNAVMDVAAMGYRSDVLYNCTTVSSCTNVANGVGWYYSDNYSWGFVNGTDNVTRNSCDTAPANPGYRVCWHTQNNAGYRCGSAISFAANYEKVIYHAN